MSTTHCLMTHQEAIHLYGSGAAPPCHCTCFPNRVKAIAMRASSLCLSCSLSTG